MKHVYASCTRPAELDCFLHLVEHECNSHLLAGGLVFGKPVFRALRCSSRVHAMNIADNVIMGRKWLHANGVGALFHVPAHSGSADLLYCR